MRERNSLRDGLMGAGAHRNRRIHPVDCLWIRAIIWLGSRVVAWPGPARVDRAWSKM